MRFIDISEFRRAFCDGKHRFDICKRIPIHQMHRIEQLFPHPGVYIFHGPNAEILSIHRARDYIGHHFHEHVDGYSRNSAPQKIPIGVSAIILDASSARFAAEIKRILQDWLNPVYK